MNITIFFSKLREEEKLLINSAKKLNLNVQTINVRKALFLKDKIIYNNNEILYKELGVCLLRCVSHIQNLEISILCESKGLPVVNSSDTIILCGDKFMTSCILEKNGIPQPDFATAFSTESAIKTIGEMGFPVVLKPNSGSWGRLLALVKDKETALSILKHREELGAHHQVTYIQKYVVKPGYDIRAFTLGGKFLCAIKRISKHWITNTARGGKAQNYPATERLIEICEKTASVIGGTFIAMDVFELEDGTLLINEVNDTPEFRNSIHTTGVNIPEEVIKHLLKCYS